MYSAPENHFFSQAIRTPRRIGCRLLRGVRILPGGDACAVGAPVGRVEEDELAVGRAVEFTGHADEIGLAAEGAAQAGDSRPGAGQRFTFDNPEVVAAEASAAALRV